MLRFLLNNLPTYNNLKFKHLSPNSTIMKKAKWIILFCLPLFFISWRYFFFQNFELFLSVQPLPSPYISDWELDPSLTFLQIDADNSETHQIFVQVIVSEATYGEVLFAQSVPLEVPQGPWNLTINNTDFLDWESVHFNAALENQIEETGRLPDGSYQICVQVINVQDGFPFAMTCAGFNILSPQPPFLIYPINDEVVPLPTPIFQWSPIAWFTEVDYILTIAEVYENQSPQDALDVNIPHFTTNSEFQNNYPYDISAPDFEGGKQYAWVIQAVDFEGNPIGDNNGISEVASFIYQTGNDITFIEPLSPGGPCVGEVTSACQNGLTSFTFGAQGEFSEFYIFLCSNPCGKYNEDEAGNNDDPSTTTISNDPQITPTLTGVQISPNPNAPAIPSEVGTVVNSFDNNIGEVVFVSQAIPANPDDNSYQVYNCNIDLSTALNAGDAFTFFVCGTDAFQNETTKSDYFCSRYKPLDENSGIPVENTPCPKAMECELTYKKLPEPKMDGGLREEFLKEITI